MIRLKGRALIGSGFAQRDYRHGLHVLNVAASTRTDVVWWRGAEHLRESRVDMQVWLGVFKARRALEEPQLLPALCDVCGKHVAWVTRKESDLIEWVRCADHRLSSPRVLNPQ